MLFIWLFFINIISFKLSFIYVLLNLISYIKIKYLQFFDIIIDFLIDFFSLLAKFLSTKINILSVFAFIILNKLNL